MKNTLSIKKVAHLLQFSDSILPVGTFSFSCGAESAIQCGIIHDNRTLKNYVSTSLLLTSKCDAVALINCLRNVNKSDLERLVHIDNDLLRRKLNSESRLMTKRMGKKLAELANSIMDSASFAWWLEQINSGNTAGTYPATQALVMGYLEIKEREALILHFYNTAMTILSAAQRLMRITHLESQTILTEAINDFPKYCDIAQKTRLEMMSSFSPVIDILAAIHVDANVRLFMN